MSDNYDQFINVLGKSISFILMPIALIVYDKKELNKCKDLFFKGGIMGGVLSSIFLIVIIMIKYMKDHNGFVINSSVFSYDYTYFNFMKPFEIHTTYYGFYILVSWFYATWHYNKFTVFWRYLSLFFVVITFFTIIFLNSRIIFILFGLGCLFFFIKTMYSTLVWTRKLMLIIATLFLFLISFQTIKNTYVYKRFSVEFLWDITEQVGTVSSSNNIGDSRFSRWKVICEAIKQKPIYGYGTGLEKELLNDIFLNERMFYSASMKYDSHNQYLSFMVQHGLIGLLFFLIYLFKNFSLGIKKKDIIYIAGLIGLVTICLVENFLNRNAGIIYSTFIFNILYQVNSFEIEK